MAQLTMKLGDYSSGPVLIITWWLQSRKLFPAAEEKEVRKLKYENHTMQAYRL